MPTYQYRCTSCGRQLEVVQKFTDPSLTECPECSGALKKVFNAVGVVFKGSGFYRTDSRTDSKSGGASKDRNGSGDSGGKDASKESGKEKVPAGKSESSGDSTSTSGSTTSSTSSDSKPKAAATAS